MLEFALGFMVAAVLALLGGTMYGFWRYAKKPFEACARSIKDLHEALSAQRQEHLAFVSSVRTELGLRKTMVLDDTTVARAETRLRAREAWNQGPIREVTEEYPPLVGNA